MVLETCDGARELAFPLVDICHPAEYMDGGRFDGEGFEIAVERLAVSLRAVVEIPTGQVVFIHLLQLLLFYQSCQLPLLR